MVIVFSPLAFPFFLEIRGLGTPVLSLSIAEPFRRDEKRTY